MFRWSSEQTCEVSETAVMLDIMMKGWICSKWSRDSIVDIVIDKGNSVYESLQVKSFTGNTIPTITRNEPNGKRATSLYKDHGVTWIAGYKKDTHEIYYYHIDNYSKLKDGKPINIKKMSQDVFPTHEPPMHNESTRNKKVVIDQGLGEFFG
jgi:hypothetical protein|tara:strand:+ start:303 stop:758 length:456 start_codon:yes stop_codon:yes gene_type:complete